MENSGQIFVILNPTGHNAMSLSTCIREVLAKVGIKKEKLISRSYDGANVMSGQHAGVQTIIKQEHPYAYFVHCYAHQLNLILTQATSQNKQVRLFFANIEKISSFFSHSPQRVAVLDETVDRRIPYGSTTRWNFHSRTVLTVYEHRQAILECLEKIEETSL